MGTCCAFCLPAKVRDYARNAENGAVTVTKIKNPTEPDSTSPTKLWIGWFNRLPICDVCKTIHAEFALSYFSKKNPDDDPTQPDSSLRREMKERK